MVDIAVLGGGPGGYVTALRAAVRGATVCCIEANKLGGTCLNVGCIPTKAMLHAGEVFSHIAHAGEYGFSTSEPGVDGPAYMQRVAGVTGQLRKGLTFLMKSRKVEVICGQGHLVSADTLMVETEAGPQEIRAKSIVIATGSQPARPGFVPWQSPRVWTTDEATTATELPSSVLILGGGVIGCEFATIYAELGIPTTIVEMLPNLLPNLDSDASGAVVKGLKQRGVTVVTGRRIVAIKADDSTTTAELDNGETVAGETCLVAVGRKANIDGIGLEELGITTADGIICVDDHCRTNVEGVYAVGDVASQKQYAHLASRMGIVAADNATGHEAADDRTIVPECVYTHPEISAVGLSQEKAQQQCSNLRTAKFPYMASGMAQAHGQISGMVKLMADGDSGRVLGALIIGPHASDSIHEVALAMKNNLTVEHIAHTIHAHPTFAEAIGEAAEICLGLPVHVVS